MDGGTLEDITISQMRFITTKPTGEEQGELCDTADVDMDIGKENDFEIRTTVSDSDTERIGYGCRIFVPGTEYGGIIKDIESISNTQEIVLRGDTWRGMLQYKIVEPPAGKDHLILSGELNTVIRMLIGDRFGDLFIVPENNTGIEVKNWKVDRYVTLYVQPEGLEYGYVTVQAVPVENYSEDIEYSQEKGIHVTVRDSRNGVNHLVCTGQGENQDRIVLHLYVQKDGSIGKTQYYKGSEEKTAVYDYSSADEEKLEEDGKKRLKELQNYKKCEMTVNDINLELGDIVAGYDTITDTQVIKPVTQKVVKSKNGEITIDYKVKGDD